MLTATVYGTGARLEVILSNSTQVCPASAEIGVRAVQVRDDHGGPVGRTMDAQQLRGRDGGRQRVQDSRLIEVGGGQRIAVGGRLHEDPSSIGQTERGGELMAEASGGGDRVSDGRAKRVLEAGSERRGDVGPLQTAGGGRY
ncbi:hypothetical protein OG604_48695 [Streptomyces sp. NBC_01231]|nr:hypothetical protein OG604_48695 [Streptomyces sp. NBC_01231]